MTEAGDAREKFIPARRRGDVVAKEIRIAAASTLVREKITVDCKEDLTIPVWPARPHTAENNESSCTR